MPNWQQHITQQTARLPNIRIRLPKTEGGSRYLTSLCRTNALLNFVSNDYLGLSNHPQLVKALCTAANHYGVGSSGAPSLSGYSLAAQDLSQSLARWLNYPACLLFNSGYQLNLGIFSALCDSSTRVWLDKRCHASHIDGILLAKARFTTFSPETLASCLESIAAQANLRHLLITEGTFSMDGSCTYLAPLLAFKQQHPHNFLLVIDDAHGVGALGRHGYGSLEQQYLSHNAADLLIGTLGKAFASHGGFICGSAAMIDYLTQSVRSQIFSTALPPALYAASSASLTLIASNTGAELRNKLLNNIHYWRTLATEYGLELYNQTDNLSPIQLVLFPEVPAFYPSRLSKQGASAASQDHQLQQVHAQLLEQDILTGKISYPTVPKNQARLRISINAAHQATDLEQLAAKLAQALKVVHG